MQEIGTIGFVSAHVVFCAFFWTRKKRAPRGRPMSAGSGFVFNPIVGGIFKQLLGLRAISNYLNRVGVSGTFGFWSLPRA